MSITSDLVPMATLGRKVAGRLWRAAWNEPLIHFILLSGLLFMAQAIWSGDRREVIVVDQATQEFLFKQRQDLLLRPLTEKEKKHIVDSYVEDEMLVREARRRGFDDNSRVRRLLVQNMRFFIAQDLGKPSDGDLRSFFETNAERFQQPPSNTSVPKCDVSHEPFPGSSGRFQCSVVQVSVS